MRHDEGKLIEHSLDQTGEAIAAALTAIGIAERYRTALLSIRDMETPISETGQSPKYFQADAYHRMRDIAREALAPTLEVS